MNVPTLVDANTVIPDNPAAPTADGVHTSLVSQNDGEVL